jgi:hypothetical protein
MLSIYIYPTVYSPYGGNPDYPQTLLSVDHPLGLEGSTPDYLNIRWNATYSDFVSHPIDVFCYLNTKNQNCTKSYVQNPGEETGCTIFLPNYDYKELNTVICNFSKPDYPTLFGAVNRSLQPVAFRVSAPPEGKPVGQMFTWKVDVLNLGILESNFTVNITSHPEGTIWINPSASTSSSIEYGKVTSFYTQVSFLVAGDVQLWVYTRPGADVTACSIDGECSTTVYSTQHCFDSKCWSKQELLIKVGLASLPEFDLSGLIQIMLLASVVFAIVLKKKK